MQPVTAASRFVTYPPLLLTDPLQTHGNHSISLSKGSDLDLISFNAQASQSQNIQTLLEAEKEAQKVVQQARQCAGSLRNPFILKHSFILCDPDRTQRLKDARSEATKEIEEYKAQKEQEFKAYEASVRTILSI